MAELLVRAQLIAAGERAGKAIGREQHAHGRDCRRSRPPLSTFAATAVDYTCGRVRILVVATKSPWPPRDGGRLALWNTMQALAAAGHELALVAPCAANEAVDPQVLATLRGVCAPILVPVRRHSWLAALWQGWRQREPAAIARHRHRVVEQAVAESIDAWRPEVIHAEQLQAFANCGAAHERGAPVVLRMQNVESQLWSQTASVGIRGRLLKFEAVRLRDYERIALRQAAQTIALTKRDAEALARLDTPDCSKRITALPPPFPAELPSGPALPGAPCVALAGSVGWQPNAQAAGWFVDVVMPRLQRALPDAQLHVFGMAGTGKPAVTFHAAPDDAAAAFPANAIAAIPLFIGSGIRMRILDAWARGLPVVASSIAAAGLDIADGRELLIADSAQAFAEAIVRLHGDAALRASLIAAGRDYLAHHHAAVNLTTRLVQVYERALRKPA
jgi:hypothetical protein